MTENNKPQASDDQQEQSGAFSDALKASREKADAEEAAPTRTLWSDAWKRLKKNKLAVIGAVWIVFVVLVALTADLWAPQLLGSPTDIDTTTVAQSSKLPPSPEHPFGTDARAATSSSASSMARASRSPSASSPRSSPRASAW